MTADPANCPTQRTLSEAGWHEARAIEALGVPVGAVPASESCRASQTADLAFGRYDKTASLNFAKAEDYTAAQTAAMRGRVAPLLAALPPARTNTVIVGHDNPFEAATGLCPEPMGVAVVVRPDGTGGFTLLGSIAPDAWPPAARRDAPRREGRLRPPGVRPASARWQGRGAGPAAWR